jgi:hypothetical protein
MKIQLANRTYHKTDGRCCWNCSLAKISVVQDRLYRIDCPDFIPQPCHNAFKKKLFNDKIFKL